MLTNGSLGEYVNMLEKMKLATRDEVKKQIEKLIKEQRKADLQSPYDADGLRNKIKAPYEEAVKQHIGGVSYKDLRKLIETLGNGDRGYLSEVWYQSHYAKTAKSQVEVGEVATDNGTQKRRIDLLHGETMIEVKDVKGPIDHDQFQAYAAMLESGTAGSHDVSSLKYVFMNPDGAVANLPWFRDKASKLRGFSVEYFDFNGKLQKATPSTFQAAIDLLAAQSAKRPPRTR